MVQAADFVNIHNHTEYSLLDGKSKIPDIVKKTKELGQCGVGICDHGNTFGMIEFYDECKKGGIKPILGTEFYFMEKEELVEGKKVRPNCHLTVIAMNNNGLISLNKLTTRAAQRFFYKPYIVMKDLHEVNDGLIVTSGCFSSQVSEYLLADEDDKAEALIKEFVSIFGDRFYIEIQDAGIPGQAKITSKLRNFSEKLSIKRVVSNDSHYINKDDFFAHSVMLAVNTSSLMSEKPTYEGGKRFAFSTNEFYMKGAEKLSSEGFSDKEIYCSREIADRCDITISNTAKLPQYPKLPAGSTSHEFLISLCEKGWKRKKISSRSGDYKARLERELSEIKSGNITDYFLIVADYCNWARNEGISVGDGRGSAAGSLVSYLLDITTIDPIKYGLYWERFWNAGRAVGGLPDIDTDFSQKRRGEVLRYIENTFGKNRVAPIITFNRMTSKLVLKDVGRVMGVDSEEMNHITSMIPNKVTSLEDALEKSEPLKILAERKYKKIFEVAKDLQDTVRNTGKHASAIVVLDKDFDSGEIPMAYDTKSKSLITGYDMYTLDRLKYMKMDCLGLKNLDIVDVTTNLIKQRYYG